jgi:heptosyltransferase II
MKILVRGANWIGDAVMSVPALRELRRLFPDDHITLHTRAWAEGIFRDASFIDEIIAFDPQRWRIREVIDNVDFLKPDKFDLAILFPNSFESSLTAALSRIPRRIGYNKDLRGLLLTDPIAVPEWKDRRHEAFYYLNLIAETGRRMQADNPVNDISLNTTIEVSPTRRSAARDNLSNEGVDLDRKAVGLGVGSTNSRAKRWPADRFAKLADVLRHELGSSVVVLGGPDDREVAGHVLEQCVTTPINLAGSTTLDEVAAILSELDLFISNDMGLAHLAAAVGTETIVIFGPTNPETTRPFSDLATVIREPVECSPCMLRDCPIDHRCMTRISVQDVFSLAKAKLKSEVVSL